MTNSQGAIMQENQQTKIALTWARHLMASDPEVARDLNNLSGHPSALAAALRSYAEAHVTRTVPRDDGLVSLWARAALAQADWHAVAVELSGQQAVLGDWTARLSNERSMGRGRT